VQQIVSRLETAYGHSLVAIALYGSTAREADREYSDVELFCVVAKNTKTDDGSGLTVEASTKSNCLAMMW
jgi:predicted nucleotidyltransferase